DVAQQIDAQLLDYQQRTGNQIAVAIVHTTGNDALEDYSIKLARQWGVGTKEKNNGVLLLIVYDDHKLRIEVGRGLEGNLTDLVSGRIIRDIIAPQMREGNAGQAVLTGTQAIRAALGDTDVGPIATVPATPPETSPSTPGWLVGVIIVGLIFFVILGQVGRRRRWPGFGGGIAGPIFWGGGFGGGGGGFGGGGGGFGGGGGGGFGGGGASGGW